LIAGGPARYLAGADQLLLPLPGHLDHLVDATLAAPHIVSQASTVAESAGPPGGTHDQQDRGGVAVLSIRSPKLMSCVATLSVPDVLAICACLRSLRV